MRITLATGFIPKNNFKSSIVKSVYPPLGLLYLSAALESDGHEVRICDCLPLNWSVNEVADYILRNCPDMVGISVMSTCYDGARKISEEIKKRGDIPIVFGGPHCSSFPEETMRECHDVDFLIYGEGESVLPMLVKSIYNKSSCCDIPQLYFRGADGKLLSGKQEMLISDIDKITYPSRHLIDNRLYLGHRQTMLTSRGCSYGKCAFCMRTGLLYEKYRRRSVENVLGELEALYKEYPGTEIMFIDDNFAQDEKWVVNFSDQLARKRIAAKWLCNARVDTVTEKMLKKMAAAGCHMIMYGLETGDQRLLDYIDKGITLDEVRRAIYMTKSCGIKTLGYFILGLPKETPELARKTIQFAVDLDLDLAQFVPARILPGTKLHKLCVNDGQIIDGLCGFYDNSAPSPFLVPSIRFVPNGYGERGRLAAMIKYAYRRFYIRYGYLKKIILNRGGIYSFRQLADLISLFLRVIFART